ncbi:MAG: diguanylate cyclase [Acidobacteria bacterium]|nr:diguanylate cyclase [Acidobacteriota bacterium]
MRILIAEDDPVSRRLLEKLLIKSGYEVVSTEDGASAWELLQAPDAPRLALLDWMMPGMDGVDVCREARKRVAGPYIYMLLLTAKDAMIDVIEGLESGADDYLTKPYNVQELKARLRVGKRILELEDNLVAAREVLQFKATHDALTGLWNRAAILDLLQREVPRARRERGSVGILLGDLDYFKSVNDTHGHLAGDEVLRDVAGRLSSAVREYDVIGRYGGEEFLVVMPGCDLATTRERAEHLRAAVGSQPVHCADRVIPVTMSLGALASIGWGPVDVETLLYAVDAALYRAKEAGRNRVELALPGERPAAAPKPTGASVILETGKL